MLILWLLLGVVVIILGVGAFTFFAACRRRKEPNWLDFDKLKKTTYASCCDMIKDAAKWLESHQTREISVKSTDGLELTAIWVPAENAKGTILLAHGYRSVMLIDFSMVMDYYHQMGLNLLIPFQRSHGKSEGKYITFGVKESDDMCQWINYHNSDLFDGSVIVSGLSMGASTVMYMLDKELPDNVVAAVVDCGFTSPAAIIGKVFKDVMHIPGGFFVRIADIFARLFGGFSLYEKDSRKTLTKNSYPILMVHGKADKFVPCYMTEQGYEKCAGDKRLLLVENAGHGFSFLHDTQQYKRLVEEVVELGLNRTE